MTYFHRRTSTIIGAKVFHGPVRDGKGWDHLAMVVKRSLLNALGHRARHFCQARATKAFQSGKKRNYESGVCERLAFELLNYVGIVTCAATLLEVLTTPQADCALITSFI